MMEIKERLTLSARSGNLTQTQCENMLSRDREAGKGHGFRVRLTEFCCEKAEDDARAIQQAV